MAFPWVLRGRLVLTNIPLATSQIIHPPLTAGLFSSALSHVISTRVVLPRLLKTLGDPLQRATISPTQAVIKPSLGASGAIVRTLPHFWRDFAQPDVPISLLDCSMALLG
jgi:hypothetical protein